MEHKLLKLSLTTMFCCLIGICNTSKAQSISAGFNFSIFRCADGTVKGTGTNSSGCLGIGTTVDHSTAVTANVVNGIIALETGNFHSVFLKNDGTVWAVGSNSNGQLGDGTTTSKSTPVQSLALSGITAITAYDSHSLFLKNDGTVWAVGSNNGGELGDGTTTGKSTPFQISGLTNIIAVSIGFDHSLFLKSDGTVWAAGYNDYGQIGNQPLFGSNVPVQIIGLSGITAVAAGGKQSLFLKSNGTVWGLGGNYNGELGSNNSNTMFSSPFMIPGLTGITAISAGFLHSIFLKSNGTVWVTGDNNYGQLGDGTTIDKNVATVLTGINGIVAISAGAYHSLFLKSDGTVRSVGANFFGGLGDGTTTQRLTPVMVNNLCTMSLSTEENTLKNDITVYPNPCIEELHITFAENLSQPDAIIELFNNQGELVKRAELTNANAVIRINELATGIYLVRVKSSKGTITRKVIKE